MSIRLHLRSLVPVTSICALSLLLGSTIFAAGQAPTADEHKAWMNDASDAQEDFRFAVTDKDQKAATAALVTLDALLAKTEAYWTAKKATDGVTLTKEARASAALALTAAKGGNLPAARDAFEKMGTSCNSCHELHLEKR